MTNKHRYKLIGFLGEVALTDCSLGTKIGAKYRFGKNKDGRLAITETYWLVQEEKYRVCRKTGHCHNFDKEKIDSLLLDWLFEALDLDIFDKILATDLSVHYDEDLEPEDKVIPSYWHKDNWKETQND